MNAIAVAAGRELVVGAARHDLAVERGDRLFGQDRAKRVGADYIGLDAQDRVGRDGVGAQFLRQRSPLRRAGEDIQGRCRMATETQQ